MSRADGDDAAARPAGQASTSRSGRHAAEHPGGRGQRIQRTASGAAARPAGPPRAAGEQRPGGAGPGGGQGPSTCCSWTSTCRNWTASRSPGDSGAGATAGGHLPIIALTARSRKEDREQCLAAGMDEFLAKPIQVADLWAAIDRVRGRVSACPNRPVCSTRGSSWPLAAVMPPSWRRICQAFRARLPDRPESRSRRPAGPRRAPAPRGRLTSCAECWRPSPVRPATWHCNWKTMRPKVGSKRPGPSLGSSKQWPGN